MENMVWILAGGKSRRMGRDKALVELAGKPMISHVITFAECHSRNICINSNADAENYSDFHYPIFPDEEDVMGAGPLAGLVSGLRYLKAYGSGQWLLVLPTDTPYLPADLITRLVEAAAKSTAKIILASFGGNLQHILGFWHVDTLPAIEKHLLSEKQVLPLLKQLGFAEVAYDADGRIGQNLNSPEDLAALEASVKD